MWTIGFACANCPEGFSCDDGLLNVDDMYAPAPALQSGSVSGSEAAPAPQSGSSSGSEPALAPQSGSVSEPAPEVCNGSKQLGECARCRKSSDCEGSFFYCPRMKMCASSSTSCPSPTASCSPRCGDSDVNADCTCMHADFSNNWCE